MSLEYEPALDPLHIYFKWLLLNWELCRAPIMLATFIDHACNFCTEKYLVLTGLVLWYRTNLTEVAESGKNGQIWQKWPILKWPNPVEPDPACRSSS